MKPEAQRLESQHLHATDAPNRHLFRFAARVEEEPHFFGHAIRRFADARFGGRLAALAEWLEITEEQLLHLRLCRMPRTDEFGLAEDCRRLNEVFGIDPEKIREMAGL